MIILGITINHNSTAAVVKDGSILSVISEERLVRIKNYEGFPRRAIKKVLEVGGVSAEDIDVVVLASNDSLCISSLRERYLFRHQPKTKYKQSLKELFEKRDPEQVKKNIIKELNKIGIHAPLEIREHHLCHAASAYYTSGWKDCVVITMDGYGDGKSASIYVPEKNNLVEKFFVDKFYSIGRFYTFITQSLGFKPLRHEGKITGLAAYGDPGILREIFLNFIMFDEKKGTWTSNVLDKIMKNVIKEKTFTLMNFLLGKGNLSWIDMAILRELTTIVKNNRREDVAAAAQDVLETEVTKWISYSLRKLNKKDVKLALAGGVFANVKLNQRVAELLEVKDVFIHPAMGDDGLALGAALLLAAEKGERKPKKLENVYFGPDYNVSEIKKATKKHGLKAVKMKDPAKEVARLIAQGKIVGHFNGRMEYGPRALGNRSILANPTDKSINEWLNKRLKRTEFMPFAPSVIKTTKNKLYKKSNYGSYAGEFMTITFDVKPEWVKKAPAVAHIDDTARPQFVTEKSNKRYFDILTEYKKITGLPLFINTSFNMHEEPIVCTPEDAIRAFKSGSVDVLVLGDYLVS